LTKIGDMYYNYWTDDKNIRGIWRRVTLEAYIAASADATSPLKWETVLDLDALNAKEDNGKNSWVWKGFRLFDEGPGSVPDLCLLLLSRGGADATVVREFSLANKSFLPESAQPFEIEEAKTRVSYRSKDVLMVGSDVGPGSLTSSGYPRTSVEWKRGTPLSSATQVYEGKESDVAATCYVSHNRGYLYEWRTRALTFYTSEIQLRVLSRDEKPGDPVPNSADVAEEFTVLAVPDDADVGAFADLMVIELRSDWTVSPSKTFKAGSLVHAPVDEMLKGNVEALSVLFAPTERTSLGYWTGTRNYVILSLLDNVKSRFLIFKYDKDSHGFVADQGVAKRLGLGEVSMDKLDCWAEDSDESDRVWVTTTGFVTPTTLSVADLADTVSRPPQKLRALPSFFDAQGIQVDQHEATSLDGTKIPYFEVYKKEGKGKPQPTLLYGYGGFEISMLPGYSAIRGSMWLERGGVWVTANIRGGGEFGPQWHQAALKEKRQRAYEDMEAVAEDLVRRKVTTAPQLGVMGGSNGGLLVGNMLVRKPELWGAVVCQVPLLDMRR
jgi:prolyl oligopeptidase